MAKMTDDILTKYFSFASEAGYAYDYLIEKSSDRSGVFIHRFKKGRDFYDFRTVSDGSERSFVTYLNGVYHFPDLKKKYKKELGAFKRKHLFHKPDPEEQWALAAELLKKEMKL